MISSHSKKENIGKSRDMSQNKNFRNSARVNDASDFKIPKDKKIKLELENGNLKEKDALEPLPQSELFLDKSSPNFNVTQNLGTGPGNVNVVCRFRPLNEAEKSNESKSEVCAEFLENNEVKVKCGEGKLYKFNFDRIFDINTRQIEVFNFSAKPILDSVLEGFNGTILTYGQTSSGKTFTMEGVVGNNDLEGIIPRTIKKVFEYIRDTTDNIEFTVKISMVEIYMEKIKDLIEPNRSNLNIREDRVKGIYIEDLSEHYVACEEEVLDLIKCGSENRTIGQTKMNENSSRSHSIFVMTIYQNNLKTMVAKTGKLFLVDLAGSEKISKTGATGLTLEQAKNINKSLTTLGMVINNLTDGKSSHVPYRDSKLTRVLQESLGGNSKTCLIITCSPSIFNHHETVSTLRFGERAKRIKNKPKINKEVTVAELKIEIEKLERVIEKANKRILQLGQFIDKNGLNIPLEDDFTFLKEKNLLDNLTNVNIDVINDDGEEMILNEESKFDDLRKGNLFTDITPQKNIDLFDKISVDDNLFSLGKLKFGDEDNKKNVSEHLEYAINAINQFTLPDEEKVTLQKELELIKNKHELIEQHLYEKINELQERLDLENRAINKIEKTKEEKEKSTTPFNLEGIENKINIKEDKYDIFEESNKNSLNGNFNNKLYSLNDAEGEIIKKIKEIQAELNDDEVKNIISDNKNENDPFNTDLITLNNLQKLKVIDLFELIKEKLFFKIPINYNFDQISKPLESNKQIDINISENNYDIGSKNFNNKDVNNELLMSIEKTDHQIIVENNAQNNIISQNNLDALNEKVQKNTEEILKKERKKFDNEKKIIIKNLEEKIIKINNLDKENKELKDRIKLLESKMSPDEKNFLKKITTLEKNLEQVNLMYHQVVTQKSVLKIENQVLEKKIKKQKEKLLLSEKENLDLTEQVKIRDEKINSISKANKINNPPSNVIRIIKGGGALVKQSIASYTAQESNKTPEKNDNNSTGQSNNFSNSANLSVISP